MGVPGESEELILYLTFSGGGTRASAFSYGVLKTLKNTEISINGKKRRLLDEVDVISAVSGGSFTAGYFGLFGDRIFQDFESKFLKKNIQGALERTVFNPFNWARYSSSTFDRSDMAAEYYDKHVFEGGTFGDIAARKGPAILINATDMVSGIRIPFTQDAFDVICSDISRFPVARAAAASSAVPGLLTPIILHNYAGTCGFKMPEELEKVEREHDITKRRFHHINNIEPYLDANKTKYIHLVDGGVADNLGIRAALDKILASGGLWKTLKSVGRENVHKVGFIVVNAETEVDSKWYSSDHNPGLAAMISSYSSIAITRYNFETIMLLRKSFDEWTEEVQKNRCSGKPISMEPGSCGDIKFYLIKVKFDALKNEEERSYFKHLPTSFNLSNEEVDKLRDAASKILSESKEFQQFLADFHE